MRTSSFLCIVMSCSMVFLTVRRLISSIFYTLPNVMSTFASTMILSKKSWMIGESGSQFCAAMHGGLL